MSRIQTVHIYYLLQETRKRPAKTELDKRAKKQKVKKVRTAKTTRTNKSANVGTNESANVGTTKSVNVDNNNSVKFGTVKSSNVETDKSAKVGTIKSAKVVPNKSVNVSTVKSANVGTNKSADSGTVKSTNVGTNKSANVGTIKSAKANKTTKRGKQQKSPLLQRKSGTVRKGKRGVSTRNAKNTTTNTKPKRASRSLRRERANKGVNGNSVTVPEDVKGEQREQVEGDTDLSEDNSEDTAPLADTKSSPKQNGTVEETGEETDTDSIKSTRTDEQLTHQKTMPSAGSDSDTQDVDHESNVNAPTSLETGPHQLDDDSNSATKADNKSSSGSERSCTPLRNYISNKSGKGCKITIKKTTNGFLSSEESGVISRQQWQSGDCSEKAKLLKSVVSKSTAWTAIATGVVTDCKTDGPTVDHVVVPHMKSDTDTDVVSDSEVVGPSGSTPSMCKTDKTLDDAASRCKIDNDTDVCDVSSRCEADAPPVDHAMSDCETVGSGELITGEPEHNEESKPRTNAATPTKTGICPDVSVFSTEEASSNAPALIFSRHSKDTDSDSLPAEQNDKSFAMPVRENQEIGTAEKSPSELIGPSGDDTEVRNNNVTSPAAHEEPIRLVYDWFISLSVSDNTI